MKKHKIYLIKNKKLRIFGAVICIFVLICFIIGVILGSIGGYKYNIHFMKVGILLSLISGIFMGILHIIYFRIPKKIKKNLFDE